MPAFISACIVAAAIAVVAAVALNTVQQSVDSAFATSSVRVGTEKL